MYLTYCKKILSMSTCCNRQAYCVDSTKKNRVISPNVVTAVICMTIIRIESAIKNVLQYNTHSNIIGQQTRYEINSEQVLFSLYQELLNPTAET